MTSFKRLVFAAVFVLCQIYALSVVQAATYYVKTNGSDAANGTSEATAWQHVTKACTTLVAGDTVLIRAGTYSETSWRNTSCWGYTLQAGFVPKNAGTSSKYIVFKGYPGDVAPIIVGISNFGTPSTADRMAASFRNGDRYIIYDGLHFRKGKGGIHFPGSGNDIHDIIIRNCTIDSTLGPHSAVDDNSGGILTYVDSYDGGGGNGTPAVRNITIEGCTIYANGAWSGGGTPNYRSAGNTAGAHIYGCDSCLFQNNIIHDEAAGIHFKHPARFSEVRGNTFYNIYGAAMWDRHTGNNTIYDYNGPWGVGSIWHHNTVYNSVACFWIGVGSVFSTLRDSLSYFYNNTCDCAGSDTLYVAEHYLAGGVVSQFGFVNRSYFFNNIFYNAPAALYRGSDDAVGAFAWTNTAGYSTPTNVYEDYNLFHGAGSGGNYYMWGSIPYSATSWKTANPSGVLAGHGANSRYGDPLFADPANHNYAIGVTSPAASSGKGGSFTIWPGSGAAKTITADSYIGALAPSGGCTLPAIPTLATPANGATGLTLPVVLDWNDVATATNYQVQLDDNSDFSSVTLDQQVTASNYSASGLTSGTTYYWRARVQNSCGWGTWAASRSFAIAACTLPAAVVLALPASGATGLSQPVVLDWNDVATATNYQVQIDNNSDFSSVTLDQQITTSTYSASGLASGTTYSWRARAQNACGWGTWSASRTFAVISTDVVAPIISGVTTTGIADNAAVITWTTNEVASTQVNYGTTTAYGSTTTLVPALLTAHSQALSGLTPLTLYHYRVRSRDTAGNEGVSGDYTFTTSEALTNLDNGITPTVSSTYEGYSLASLTDGQLNPFGAEASTWASTESATQAHWVEVNMGSSRLVKKVILYWAWNSFQSEWMTSQQVKLQSWNGTAFVDISTTNNAVADSCTIINVASVSTARLRYYQPANMGAASYPTIAWLAEIDIFGTTATNTAPTVPTLSSPAAGATVSTLAPALVLNNSTDPQGNPITYDFQVSTATTFATIAAQVAGTAQGSGTTTTWTVSPNLTSGTTYYWRVRSYDGSLYSAYAAYRSFTTSVTNTAPTVPTLSSPAAGATVSTLAPALVLNNSTDPQGNPITYDLQVSTATTFATIAAQATGVTQGTGTTTSWTVTPNLTSGTTYYWRVRAYDGALYSAYAAYRSFTTSVTNTAPTVPTLSSPTAGATVTTLAPTLVLNNSTDAQGNPITYDFQVSTATTFATIAAQATSVTQGTGTTTSWTVSPNLTSGTTYYWRVRAYDGALYSAYAAYRSFTTSVTNTAPGVPTPQSPINAVRISDVTPDLVVLNAIDANGDPLTYQFEVYNSAGTVLVVQSPVVGSGSTTTAWTVSPSLAYRTGYTWRARASDGQLWSSWTALQTFRTTRAPAVAVSADQPVDSDAAQSSKQYLSATSFGQSVSDSAQYQFEVYDGQDSTLLLKSSTLPADSGTVAWAVPSDLESGKQYFWRVRASEGSDSSEWAPLQSFTKTAAGCCGDEDGSGTVDIRDAIYLLNYIFASGPASRGSDGDVNCDEQTSISDAVLLIQYLFAHGSDPCAKGGR